MIKIEVKADGAIRHISAVRKRSKFIGHGLLNEVAGGVSKRAKKWINLHAKTPHRRNKLAKGITVTETSFSGKDKMEQSVVAVAMAGDVNYAPIVESKHNKRKTSGFMEKAVVNTMKAMKPTLEKYGAEWVKR